MPDSDQSSFADLAAELATYYAGLPQVRAIAVGGSLATGMAEEESDLDLYVFTAAQVPLEPRRSIAAARADLPEVGNQTWGDGDEWVERATGQRVDVIFFGGAWMEEQLDRTLGRHEASVGYSTAFWHTMLIAQPLFDRDGWFAALQRRAQAPYPEELRRAIVSTNHTILRNRQSSYRYQINRALGRGDLVSVNHRVAGLLASVFDIIFAVNRMPHPGEKRLAVFSRSCKLLPPGFHLQLDAVLMAACSPDQDLLAALDALLDGLDGLLLDEGLILGPGE